MIAVNVVGKPEGDNIDYFN